MNKQTHTSSFKPFIVGLTGGIGSGKTVASDHFARIGVPIVDTDVIARQIVEPGQPALLRLVETFGERILNDDNSLNRDQMRQIAFSSKDNKAKLDAITHPAIQQVTAQQIQSVVYPYCVVVVPLLAQDSPFHQLSNRILVVTANTEVRIQRVMKRSDLRRDAVEKIIESQLSDKQRLSFADDVIENDTTIEAVEETVEKLHDFYLELSTQNIER